LSLKESIRRDALDLGFDLVGVAPPGPYPEHEAYLRWLDQGLHGEMGYMARNPEKRRDVREILPSARSVVVCALDYHTRHPLSTEIEDPERGWISRYAWGDDYHDVVKAMLLELVERIRARTGPGLETKVYVDTGPVSDRVLAYRAGLGWFAKNTCIIHPKLGSWLFIGSAITNLELEPDLPMADHCGTCRLCLDACPTSAFPAPLVLDSNRCISYLTIEVKGTVPESMEGGTGNHVFGCDVCQDVCPWNRKAPAGGGEALEPREGNVAPRLEELLELDREAFNRRFRKSPLKRPKWRGFLRNVLLALGNAGSLERPAVREKVRRLASCGDEVVSRTAARVLERLHGG
jgi:epoxyqueuosine reductase